MQVDLHLEVYDGRGLVTLLRHQDLPYVPRQGESFTVGPGLTCSVEQVSGDISGKVEVRLRLQSVAVADASALVSRLIADGWQPLAQDPSGAELRMR